MSEIGTRTTTGMVVWTMLWKEWREALKTSLVGLLIIGLGLAFAMSFQRSIESVGVAGAGPSVPISLFTFTSALVGLMLGRAQVGRESRGDRWAFLTHRPVTRSTLFWGKAVAGISLYVVITGVPLALAMMWVATPGHRAIPFDPRLALPGVADLLCGLVYYFAAFLMAMREARWYGSRFLPVGAAILCSAAVIAVPRFWEAEAIVLVSLVVVGTAAWGSFVAGGQYGPQPRMSRAALGLVVGSGLQIAGVLALGIFTLVVSFKGEDFRNIPSTSYEIASNGAVVRATTVLHPFSRTSEVTDVRDLRGHPVDQYRDSAARTKLTAGVISTGRLPLNSNAPVADPFRDRGYRGTDAIFVPIAVQTPRTPSATSWYFVRRLGLIAAYDDRSAQLIGWMGPDGFVAGDAKPSRAFAGSMDWYTEPANVSPLIAFPGAVYRLDVQQRRIQMIYTPPPGESVLGAVSSSEQPVFPGVPISLPDATTAASGATAQFDAITTAKAVYVQSLDGTSQLAIPLDSGAVAYGALTVSRALLAPGAPTFVWYRADNGTVARDQLHARGDRITEIGRAGAVIAQYALPADTTTPVKSADWGQIVVQGLSTPLAKRVASGVFASVTAVRDRTAASVQRPAVSWLLSILASLGATVLTIVLGRRWALGRNRLALWGVLGLALGPLGVLLMLALFDWPAREPCPACGRQCVVTRTACEHCGKPFPPPAREGTEIFEPVTADLVSHAGRIV